MHNRAKGVGLGVVLTGYMVVCYYVPILSWVMHYFRSSFHGPLPWAGRGEEFYMDDVIQNVDPIPGVVDGGTVVSYASYPGKGMIGETVGWCAFIWFCVWLCMFKGIALTGRAIWVTMGLPLVMLFVLIGGSASLEDSIVGVRYYFAEWHGDKLAAGKIWQAACGQVFFSIGVGFGYFTTYSSFNPRFAHAVQDTLIIAFSNSLYEVTAGFIVFSIIGFLGMTPEKDGQDLSTFTVGFLTYPLALVEMPASGFFSVIWFLTIALLGLSSAVALIESLITVVNESVLGVRAPRWAIASVLTLVSFLISLVYCTEFGFYFLDAVDTWVNDVSLPISVWCEIVSVSVLYRYRDVVSQVGFVSYCLFNATYVMSMILGVILGHAVEPAAGAGLGFGVFIVGTVASLVLAKTPDSIAPRFWGRNIWLCKLWWIAFYSVSLSEYPYFYSFSMAEVVTDAIWTDKPTASRSKRCRRPREELEHPRVLGSHPPLRLSPDSCHGCVVRVPEVLLDRAHGPSPYYRLHLRPLHGCSSSHRAGNSPGSRCLRCAREARRLEGCACSPRAHAHVGGSCGRPRAR